MKPNRLWPGWRRAVWCAAAGAAFAASFPPLSLWPLALVGLVPLLLAARDLPPGKAFGAGLAFGCAAGLGMCYWVMVVLTLYGGLSYSLAMAPLLVMVVFMGLFPALFICLLRAAQNAGLSPLLAGPLLWAGLEWVRGWVMTGFPWLPLCNSVTAFPPLLQTAEWWGGTGVSALLVLVNLLTATGLAALGQGRGPKKGLAWICLALLTAGAATGWGFLRMEQVDRASAKAPKLAVSVVQGNAGLDELYDPKGKLAALARLGRLTSQAAHGVSSRPWLVVWPESAANFYFVLDAPKSQATLSLARELKADILLGSVGIALKDGKPKPTNRIWLVGPDGKPAAWYDKVHLVPFGEYVPLEQVLFFVRALAQVGENMVPGNQGDTLSAAGTKVGPLICYESLFPELARHQKLNGARLLVNITNDAWFGRSSAPYQHLSHLVVRCVENRLAAARAANTGVSCFVTPDGRVEQATDIFVRAQRSRNLPLVNLPSLYARIGHFLEPAWLALFCLALLGRLAMGRKRS